MITIPILLTIFTVIILFIAFTKQIAPVELLALTAASFLLLTGTLKTDDLLSVFSNPAAMTVAAMFVLSAALEKTGVIDYLGKIVLSISSKSKFLALGAIFTLVFLGSFFVNNTSIVLIMIPVMIALAHSLSIPASKMLIPLSYVSILGGTCTLIGTSTNLLVDGVSQKMGIPAFGIFEILVPGLLLASVGGAYLFFASKILLPVRESASEFFDQNSTRQYITQIHINETSGLVGKTIKEAGFLEKNGYQPVRLIKSSTKKIITSLQGSKIGQIFRHKTEVQNYTSSIDEESVLEIGDRLTVITNQRQVLTFHKNNRAKTDLPQEQSSKEDQNITIEGIVAPESSFVGKFIHELHLGELYNVVILAVNRHKGKISSNFDNIKLAVGDTMLLSGKGAELKRIFENDELLNLTKPTQEPYSYKKAPIAIATIVFAVLAAVFNIMPIAGSAFVAAVFVVLVGCLKNKDAYKALHGQVLLLIYAMLAISVAMEKTGALRLVVDNIMSLVNGLPPFVVISVLYLLTSIITEIFSNNAAAVMLTPIAIGLAHQMGLDPKAFAVAIMFGASASFATPIGYQTNTLVFHAGGYKFTDYLRIGLPMNIVMWIAASFIISWYWGI